MADLVLSAKDGYSFAGGDQGEVITANTSPTGSHGYLNTDPEMNAMFLAWGRGIKPHTKLKELRNVDIGPTIASLLGLSMKDTVGSALLDILQK